MTMSPFMQANKIKKPLLLIHGEADNNTGTFPMQASTPRAHSCDVRARREFPDPWFRDVRCIPGALSSDACLGRNGKAGATCVRTSGQSGTRKLMILRKGRIPVVGRKVALSFARARPFLWLTGGRITFVRATLSYDGSVRRARSVSKSVPAALTSRRSVSLRQHSLNVTKFGRLSRGISITAGDFKCDLTLVSRSIYHLGSLPLPGSGPLLSFLLFRRKLGLH